MAAPKVRRILKRLLQDPEFQELSAKAQADPKNVKQYVMQARKRFNLSPYWEILLEHILILGSFNEKILHSGLAIERSHDPVTGREYFKIVVFPETTQKEVVATYGRITKQYQQSEQTIDVRSAKRDEVEYRALQLHLKGKNKAHQAW